MLNSSCFMLPNEQYNQPLAPLHTMHMGLHAQYYWPVLNEESLRVHLTELKNRAQDMPLYYLGSGSNTVFLRDFPGLIVHLRTRGIQVLEETSEEVQVRVAAGENWHEWVQYSLKQGWYGIENLISIPGTVGAAPVQNIGAYGVEVASAIDKVLVLDWQAGKEVELSSDDCQFDYRKSIFQVWPEWLIVSVVFRLRKRFVPQLSYQPLQEWWEEYRQQFHRLPTAKELADYITQMRKSKLPDPVYLGNSGSFFHNPVVSAEKKRQLNSKFPDLPAYPLPSGEYKLAAGWMIDRLGLKGFSVGDMGVHQHQALVLVNKGKGVPEELLDLIAIIQGAIDYWFDIRLQVEPKLI